MLVDSPRPRRTRALASQTTLWQPGSNTRTSAAFGAVHAKAIRVSPVRAARLPRRSSAGLLGLWDRFSDDRDLLRLKIIVLAALVAFVAIMERVI